MTWPTSYRSTKRSLQQGLLVTSLFLFLLCLFDGREPPERRRWRRSALPRYYRVFWSSEASQVDGRYPGRYLPYLVFPAVEEEFIEGLNLIEHLALWMRKSNVFLQHLHPQHLALNYIQRPPPPSDLSMGLPDDTSTPWGPKLPAITDYFLYLKTPQVQCRKLVRLGGTFQCEVGQGNDRNMDGHKYICLEPAFELPGGRHPDSCLTLSIGTQQETSFDLAMSELPCEVHMFDVLDYGPLLAKQVPHVYFHRMGLSSKIRVNRYQNMNVSAEMKPLRVIVEELHLTRRPIHILKVDIENDEWEAFKDITSDPIMDAIGQIALEVHAVELLNDPSRLTIKKMESDQLSEIMQDRYDVLRAIESRGFRRVVYWDNVRDKWAYYAQNGQRFETSGEVLYVNTNWYSQPFKGSLRQRGFKL